MNALDRAINNYCNAVEAHSRASASVQKAAEDFLENERKGNEKLRELREGIEKLHTKLDSFGKVGL